MRRGTWAVITSGTRAATSADAASTAACSPVNVASMAGSSMASTASRKASSAAAASASSSHGDPSVRGPHRSVARVPYTDAPPGWWQSFVAATPARTAKLAVVRADGSPHVAPVWVDVDGNDVVFMTSLDTIKGKAIRRDPRVSLCWDDERPPFSFVTIAGRASTSDDPDELLRWATRIGGRYMGADRAEEYGRRNGVPPEVVVRVTPTNIVAKVDVAD